MTKKLLALALTGVFALTGVASADLLTNGDFSLDDGVDPANALDWVETTSGGWMNREQSATWPDPADFHYALGNAGGYGATVHQDVTVADDGSSYGLSADSMLDAWWLNSGYLKLEFYDAGAVTMLGEVESTHWTQSDYDTGVPMMNYQISGQAPAGTEIVRAVLGTWGEGGTARFDNAVLEVVPEPATLSLFGVAGLALWIRRKLRVQ